MIKFNKKFTKHYTRAHDVAIKCAMESIGTFSEFADEFGNNEQILVCSIVEFLDAYIIRDRITTYGVDVLFNVMFPSGKIETRWGKAYHGKKINSSFHDRSQMKALKI